jgi:fructose-1,6-bisphosphatase
MKILARNNNMAPIYMAAGDSIVLSYTDERGVKREVLRKTVGRAMIVDDAVVFDLDKKELKKMGWKDGIGGAFGVSA